MMTMEKRNLNKTNYIQMLLRFSELFPRKIFRYFGRKERREQVNDAAASFHYVHHYLRQPVSSRGQR
jgi:hypothetical protein